MKRNATFKDRIVQDEKEKESSAKLEAKWELEDIPNDAFNDDVGNNIGDNKDNDFNLDELNDEADLICESDSDFSDTG